MSRAFEGLHAVVVGFGVSGRAAAKALAEEGAVVRVSEARGPDELAQDESARRTSNDADGTGGPEIEIPAAVEVSTGGHRPEHLDGADVVVASPGVPEHAPILQWAGDRGVPVWSELEVGARLCRVPVVAVTGTNGKTTTVEMIAAMMRAAGLAAEACGNVGYPFSLAARERYDALAVEASSFQLRFQESLHPRVSVLLNVAPDHLDWHGSFDAYTEAKARIFARQSPPDVHVGNRDDPHAARVSRRARCVRRWFRLGEPEDGEVGATAAGILARMPAASINGAQKSATEEPVDLGLPPSNAPAFVIDAAAAGAAGLSFGLPIEAIRRTVASFEPLPHRGGLVGEVDSVRFLDNSKATNPHAALAALEGFDHIVLIAGGLAKGVDLSPLAQAAARLAGVIAIGTAAPDIAAVFKNLVPVDIAGSMEDAVRLAWERSPKNGTVILAPACASQDMFRDYRERGEQFAAAVSSLARRPVSAGSSPRSRGHRGG
jgi:UDP-N-acetylmuramoylalanine--D-glutamate ligase